MRSEGRNWEWKRKRESVRGEGVDRDQVIRACGCAGISNAGGGGGADMGADGGSVEMAGGEEMS